MSKFCWRFLWSTQSSFQKLNFSNSSKKTRGSRYHTFLVLYTFTGFLYFLPNTLSRIVGWFFLYWGLEILTGRTSSKSAGLLYSLFGTIILNLRTVSLDKYGLSAICQTGVIFSYDYWKFKGFVHSIIFNLSIVKKICNCLHIFIYFMVISWIVKAATCFRKGAFISRRTLIWWKGIAPDHSTTTCTHFTICLRCNVCSWMFALDEKKLLWFFSNVFWDFKLFLWWVAAFFLIFGFSSSELFSSSSLLLSSF